MIFTLSEAFKPETFLWLHYSIKYTFIRAKTTYLGSLETGISTRLKFCGFEQDLAAKQRFVIADPLACLI